MTIRVERESLIAVCGGGGGGKQADSRTSSSSNNRRAIVDAVPNHDTKQQQPQLFLSLPPMLKGNNNNIDDDDDDDESRRSSLCSTISTSSITSFDSEWHDDCSFTIIEHDNDSSERVATGGVSFAPRLVTDVWTRERTAPEDVSKLFYSGVETQGFRRQYHLEKRLLRELSIDPETFPVTGCDEELSNLVAEAASSRRRTHHRHCISRVVISHNNTLESFFGPTTTASDDDSRDDNDDGCDCDFDSDSFWSGSLTWY